MFDIERYRTLLKAKEYVSLTCGAISGTLLLILLDLDMIGLIFGVPGVQGAVEDLGSGESD